MRLNAVFGSAVKARLLEQRHRLRMFARLAGLVSCVGIRHSTLSEEVPRRCAEPDAASTRAEFHAISASTSTSCAARRPGGSLKFWCRRWPRSWRHSAGRRRKQRRPRHAGLRPTPRPHPSAVGRCWPYPAPWKSGFFCVFLPRPSSRENRRGTVQRPFIRNA